ncbi:helicase associated domain-containing protein [Streptomyces eurythermus]|uniref:helicase associated domain-containing protein n=1 Tax=Streptomyces eurythermus TaxID=42237 RepID=UPI0036997231
MIGRRAPTAGQPARWPGSRLARLSAFPARRTTRTDQLGVWVSSTRQRRDKLTAEQRAALAALGMDWAGAVPAVEAAPEPPAPQPAPPAASKKQPVREHHEV